MSHYMIQSVESAKALRCEIHAAALWMARSGYAGKLGDPLPGLLSTAAYNRIMADLPYFRRLIREFRRAI